MELHSRQFRESRLGRLLEQLGQCHIQLIAYAFLWGLFGFHCGKFCGPLIEVIMTMHGIAAMGMGLAALQYPRNKDMAIEIMMLAVFGAPFLYGIGTVLSRM